MQTSSKPRTLGMGCKEDSSYRIKRHFWKIVWKISKLVKLLSWILFFPCPKFSCLKDFPHFDIFKYQTFQPKTLPGFLDPYFQWSPVHFYLASLFIQLRTIANSHVLWSGKIWISHLLSVLLDVSKVLYVISVSCRDKEIDYWSESWFLTSHKSQISVLDNNSPAVTSQPGQWISGKEEQDPQRRYQSCPGLLPMDVKVISIPLLTNSAVVSTPAVHLFHKYEHRWRTDLQSRNGRSQRLTQGMMGTCDPSSYCHQKCRSLRIWSPPSVSWGFQTVWSLTIW